MQQRKTRLDILAEKAAGRARTLRRGVLISLCERIAPVDPLEALESMDSALTPDRMFWAVPDNSVAFAAAGSAGIFEHSGHDRFARTNKDLRDHLSDAVIEGAPAGLAAAGPVLVGGFSFDEDGPRTELWSGFGSSRLFLPAVMVTAVNDETWLTLNAIVGEDGACNPPIESLAHLADRVSESSSSLSFEAQRDTVIRFDEADEGAGFVSLVAEAVSEIERGEFQKVVLARTESGEADADIDAFATVRNLLAVHRRAFVFALWNGEKVFVGASPELLARQDGRTVYASSLAGTIERGSTPEADSAKVEMLRSSEKDLAEHAAVRNELYDVLSVMCDDVIAPEVPTLLTLSNVHHLHTPLSATLRNGGSLLDIVERLHPTPAVGGAPRDAALRFIHEHEALDRGWYAGPIGWIGGDKGEFAVALRSALVDGDEATLFAGCGIVRDSDPESELDESNLKLQAMKSALGAALVSQSQEPVEMSSAGENDS
ncbi:MAG TPA: isochorismate synthase [Gemmatimonadaceae bacterium]